MSRVARHREPERMQDTRLGEATEGVSNCGLVWIASLSLAMAGECAGGA
jgi:hypothetical protein